LICIEEEKKICIEVFGEWFIFDIFNDIKCPGLPNHCLTLKVGVSIIILMNID